MVGIFTEGKNGEYNIEVEKPEAPGSYHDTQKLEKYIFKEEPNFKDLGKLFGKEGGASILNFSKLIEDPTVLNEFQRLSNGKTGETILFRKMRACFKENMELKRFPFDRQLLQFKITAAVPVNALELKEDVAVPSCCNVKDLAEYEVREVRETKTLKKENGKEVEVREMSEVKKKKDEKIEGILTFTEGSSVSTKKYSQAKVTLHVQRKPHKYMVNIVFMIYMLVLASCSSFVIPLEKTGERAGNIITYILTIMALKYVINDQLPGKDYQTLLDYYLLFSYVLLTLPALELLVLQFVHTFWRSIDLNEIDSACAKVFFVVWNVPHWVVWLLYPCRECFYQPWDQVHAKQGSKTGDETSSKDATETKSWKNCWNCFGSGPCCASAREPLLQESGRAAAFDV